MVGSQNILNHLREQQEPPKKKNTFDIELLIELERSYPCIWNVKLSVHKDNLKRKLAWNEIKESLVENIGGNHFFYSYSLNYKE